MPEYCVASPYSAASALMIGAATLRAPYSDMGNILATRRHPTGWLTLEVDAAGCTLVPIARRGRYLGAGPC